MPDHLRALLDQRELDDLVHTTVRSFDDGDWAAYARCFAPDVEFVLPDHAASDRTGTRVITGVEHFIPVLRSTLAGFDAVQHHISNTVHRVVGDEATTTCYVVAEQFLGDAPGENSVSVGGSYAIGARRDADGWRLTRWHFTPRWTRGNPGLFALAARRVGEDPGPERTSAPVGAREE